MVDKFYININIFLWYFPWITNEFYSYASFKCEFTFISLLSQKTRGLTENVYHCRPKLLNWIVQPTKEMLLDNFRRDTTNVPVLPSNVLSQFPSYEGNFTLSVVANENINKTSNGEHFKSTARCSHDYGK